MTRRKIGVVKLKTALNVLCGLYAKQDVLRLLSSNPETWEETVEKRCFKKTGSSTDAIIIECTNDSIAISGLGYGENVNLQALGQKGQTYIEKPQYSIGIDEENYKNARIAIPDLNRLMGVYEVSEDFDPTSKGLLFDFEDPNPIDLMRTYIVYEDANNDTQHTVIDNSICTPYNCDSITQYYQQGQNPVFDTKSAFAWKANIGQGIDLWDIRAILAANNTSTNGYKLIKGSYKINCRVYDSLDKAEVNDPAESENATDEQDETPAEDRTVVLFYTDKVSRTTFGQNDTADYFSHTIQFRVQYKTNEGEKIIEPKQAIVGYVKSSIEQSTFSNIEWVKHSKTKILDAKWTYGPEGGQKHSGKTPPNETPDIMGFYDQVRIDNYNYRAKFGTNMLIFANRSDAERYLDGDLSVRPIYDGNSGRFDEQGDIGDRYIYNTQSYDISNEMSSVWILNKAQLDDLASVLATGLTKAEIGDELLLNITRSTARSFTALAEPVDMVCDLFWLPVSVTEFCNSHEDTMQFGEDTYGIIGTVDSVVDSATGAVYKANSTVERMNSKISDMMKDQMSRMLTEGIDVRVEEEPQPPTSN